MHYSLTKEQKIANLNDVLLKLKIKRERLETQIQAIEGKIAKLNTTKQQ